jgi:hypothetical protein
MARRRNACSLWSADRAVDGAGQPHRQHRRRLGLDREIGQDVAHGGLVGQRSAERAAVPGVVDRLGQRRAHPGGRADDAVQPGHGDHLDDRAHAVALVADEPADRAVELGLAARVAAVAELVLEALDAEHVARAVREHPGHQEARQARGRLREHEEQVAHGRAGEPLVPTQPVAAVAGRRRCGGVGPYVGAALLLGHAHTGQQSALAERCPQARVVDAADQQGLVGGGQLGRVA